MINAHITGSLTVHIIFIFRVDSLSCSVPRHSVSKKIKIIIILMIPSHSYGTKLPLLSSSVVQVNRKQTLSEVEGRLALWSQGRDITISYLSTNQRQASILVEVASTRPGVSEGHSLVQDCKVNLQPTRTEEVEVGT